MYLKLSCLFLGIFLLASCTSPYYSGNYEYRPVNYVPATSTRKRTRSSSNNELWDIYTNAQQDAREFNDRILPLQFPEQFPEVYDEEDAACEQSLAALKCSRAGRHIIFSKFVENIV